MPLTLACCEDVHHNGGTSEVVSTLAHIQHDQTESSLSLVAFGIQLKYIHESEVT